jgi:hypothetical protein
VICEFSLRRLPFKRVEQPIGERLEETLWNREPALIETNRARLKILRLDWTDLCDWNVALTKQDRFAGLQLGQILRQMSHGLMYVDPKHHLITDLSVS